MPDRPELFGPGEIAAFYGVNPSTVRYWRTRDGFPRPVELASGPVWFAEDVKDWRATRLAIKQRERAF